MTNREQRMRQVRRQKMILGISFLVILLLAVLMIVKACGKKPEEKTEPVQKAGTEKTQAEQAKKLPHVEVDLSGLNSAYAVLAERETGKILAEKGSDDKIYPASMTKIMTTLVAMEELEDMEQMIFYPRSLYGELLEEHPSFAGYEPDEEISVKDLLYGVMLPSGAECCKLLAAEAAGSEEAFVKKMNAKAKELGMENTHFTNASGFHDENHYSTVSDILFLLRSALENKTFYKIFTTNEYTGGVSDSYPKGTTFKSTMLEAMEELEISQKVTGGSILGGKTGYTEQAGSCLASLASIDGNEYILVTAKADRPSLKSHLHVKDAVDVYNQIGEYLEKNKD